MLRQRNGLVAEPTTNRTPAASRAVWTVSATDMAARDQSDTTRKVAPLQMASDAIYVDTTELDAEQVFQ